jgi:hypothetical protein
MKTTARESQQMNQTQRSSGNAAVAPSVSVTISNKGTGGTNTARTSPKGGKGAKQNYDEAIEEDHEETADYAEVQDTETVEDKPGRLKM